MLMTYVATTQQQSDRRRICDSCPEKTVVVGADVCGKCKCVLVGKVVLTDAKCPLNKWIQLR
jgi:hypothetical protein